MLVSMTSREIAAIARRRGPNPLPALLLRRLFTEAKIRLWKGLAYRTRCNEAAAHAYRAIAPDEFEDLNVLQAWANWRTIPRNLSGRLPATPIHAVDLCCGTGASTEVLAYYAPPGSRVLGLEVNPGFLEAARRRRYVSKDGAPIRVEFNAQSVLEVFRDPDGLALDDCSIDLVNASGAVAFHFDERASRALAREVDRVLKPGGLATIDAGRGGTTARALTDIFARRAFSLEHSARSCPLDRGLQLCLRKAAAVRPASAAARGQD